MVDRIGELLNALTEDAQKAVLAKCKEHNFDPDKGDIPLQESFINLTAACATLKESVDQKKLIQLPLTVQKIFASHLETIQRFQTELINGADQVVNLGNAIEALHFNIWMYGLPQLSGEVLGFQTKMNQLKRLDVEVVKLKDKLESGLELKSALQELQEKSSEYTAALQKLVTDSIETAKKVGDNLSATTEASQKAAAILATIQQSDATSSQLSAATQASNATTLALEQKIKEFYKQIDEYREKINLTTDDAANVTRKNTADTTELISNLTNLEDQIKTQIQKATGFSLFHSFQTRQDSLVKSKRLWIYAILGLVAISVGITLWIIQTVPEGTALSGLGGAFYLKLTISIPIIFLIAFCTLQYSRERRLEEEYAFKSSISISLIPYQELVDKLTDKTKQPERERYAIFIIDSITKVFSSPTDKVFDSERKSGKLNVKTMKELTDLFETFQKVLKP